MALLPALAAWWRRSIVVERASDNTDVHLIRIDAGDGSPAQEALYSRRDIFGLAWVCGRIVEEHGTRAVHSVTLTAEPLTLDDGEVIERALAVPDWARARLYRAIERAARGMGWRGECPRPSGRAVYR